MFTVTRCSCVHEAARAHARHSRLQRLGQRVGLRVWCHGLRRSSITAALDAAGQAGIRLDTTHVVRFSRSPTRTQGVESRGKRPRVGHGRTIMRRALAAVFAGVLALIAAPTAAQTIISTHPPLSPEEAVRVLRGSHSIADLTDYRSPGTGPTVVVTGASMTPWDWPSDARAPVLPLAPTLWEDTFYIPRGYRAYGDDAHSFRSGGGGHRAAPRVRADAPAASPAPPAPIHLRVDAASSGAVVRR